MVSAYGRRRSQVGELFLPEAGGPWPVAVVVHGGFWRAGYGRRLMDALCTDLAGRGWAAWNLEYRRLGLLAGGGWPATFLDVAAGIDHLGELAERDLSLDLSCVVAIGHSAGGHLALWAAARTRLPEAAPGGSPRVRVTHAVSQAGVADLAEAARLGLGGGVVRRLLGGMPDKRLERYSVASPAELLPLGVPQLLVHGGRDGTVPAEMSRRYVERALGAGDPVELVVLSDDGHFEHLDPGSEAWGAVIRWLEANR